MFLLFDELPPLYSFENNDVNEKSGKKTIH